MPAEGVNNEVNNGADRFAKMPKPTNVLVCDNLPPEIWSSSEAKTDFQKLFTCHGDIEEIEMEQENLRCRVVFTSYGEAIHALNAVHGKILAGTRIHAFYGPSQELDMMPMEYLNVPIQTKQFLISPPASPPVDWESVEEDPPIMEQEFLSLFEGAELHAPPGVTRVLVKAEEAKPAICVCDYSDPTVDDGFNKLNHSVMSARLAAPAVETSLTRMPPRREGPFRRVRASSQD